MPLLVLVVSRSRREVGGERRRDSRAEPKMQVLKRETERRSYQRRCAARRASGGRTGVFFGIGRTKQSACGLLELEVGSG